MENVSKALDDVIQCILSSKEYQNCISLKNKMNENDGVMCLIEEVKKTQKKYIRSGYSSSVKKELDYKVEQLMNIPIYHVYQESLEKVNMMISYVRESLNDYFENILNS